MPFQQPQRAFWQQLSRVRWLSEPSLLASRPWQRREPVEVKECLLKTYPNTEMRGDGQVVMVKFLTYNVEVAPAFQLNTGKYWICNTNNGGSYTTTDPQEE